MMQFSVYSISSLILEETFREVKTGNHPYG
jgi:hypothetical protein